jgi:iron complex outermembrane receptor protein
VGANAYRNSPSVYATLAPQTQAVANSTLLFGEVSATRRLMTLPGGDLTLAVGAHVQRISQFAPGQPGCQQGDVVEPVACVVVDGSTQNQAVFSEVSAPLTRSLETDFALREDHYVGIGDATTPKFSFAWRPWDVLMLRGSYERGFRAPGPGERGSRSEVLSALPPLSIIIQGNPALKPERSENYGLGLVVQPSKALSASVDWYKIRRNQSITLTPFQNAVIIDNTFAFFPYVNANLDLATGLDLNVQWRQDLGAWGRVTSAFDMTHILHQKECVQGVCYEAVDTHGNSSVSGDTGTPRDRAQLSFADQIGSYQAGFTVNYVSGMRLIDTENYGPGCDALDTAWYPACKTGSFTDVDLFGSYKQTRALTFNLHLLNAFDRHAVFDPNTVGGHNYNPAWSQAGAIGRYVELGAVYRF